MLEEKTGYGGFISEVALLPITLPGAVQPQLAAFLLHINVCECVSGKLYS